MPQRLSVLTRAPSRWRTVNNRPKAFGFRGIGLLQGTADVSAIEQLCRRPHALSIPLGSGHSALPSEPLLCQRCSICARSTPRRKMTLFQNSLFRIQISRMPGRVHVIWAAKLWTKAVLGGTSPKVSALRSAMFCMPHLSRGLAETDWFSFSVLRRGRQARAAQSVLTQIAWSLLRVQRTRNASYEDLMSTHCDLWRGRFGTTLRGTVSLDHE